MFLVALCGVAMLIGTSSCKKEKQENENEGEMMRIEVSVGGTDGNTKTHLVHGEHSYKVAWDTWDAFNLFPIDKNNGSSFRFCELVDDDDVTTAVFEGFRPGEAPYYGCYPSGKVSCERAGVFKFTIDETQEGNPETVDGQTATANAGPMVGYMKDAESGLVFQNTMSWLKVGLTGNAIIKRVVLTDLGDEQNPYNNKLNGTLSVTCSGEGGNFTFTSEMDPDAGTNKLAIVSNEGVELNDGFTYFWFQVPAGSLKNLELDAYLDVDGLTKVLELTKTIPSGVSENTVLTAEVNSPITATEAEVTTAAGCSNENIYQLKATVTGKDDVFTTYMVGVCYNYADGEDPTIDNCVGHQEIEETFTIANGSREDINYDLVGLEIGREYKIRAYATNGVYAYSNCMKIVGGNVPLPLPSNWVNGKNTHPFTVGSDKVVYFSQGNLQYIGSAATPYWKFAEHQCDLIGDGQNGSSASNIDRDLFGWGDLTGYNISGDNADYQWTDDWGTKIGTGWRTLTGGVGGEWDYLINTRKKDGNLLYGEGKVGNCTPGLIILPDDWICPDDLTFSPGHASGFKANFYTYSEWAQMEAAGAVFLPAAGYRDGAVVWNVGSYGNYWSSSSPNSNSAYSLTFFNIDFISELVSELITDDNFYRYYGFSVRLVSDIPPAK